MYSYHIHSSFSDGKNSPEEMVQAAIAQGVKSMGFSDHGYTFFDESCCIKDTQGYIREIRRLKEAYQKEIQILLGVEEEAFSPVDRKSFQYIIGSCHYICKDGRYYPIDMSPACMEECFALFQSDAAALAECYYSGFCRYILDRKPDIIGHFDLLTKYDERGQSRLLENAAYQKVAARYLQIAAQSGSLFEVNTGAIARGYRTSPYPSQELLWILKKQDAGIILSSDSHKADTVDFGFAEARAYLREIGFRFAYRLTETKPEKYSL